MQAYLVEDLAFSEDNQNWIREEIQKAIYPNGFRKVADRLRYWGLLAVCITAFVALLAIAVSLGIYVASTMNRESEFRGATSEQLKTVSLRLTDIENTLKFLRAQTVAQKYSAVPIPELRKHRVELVEAKKNLANLPPGTPNYWPASFQIITLVSQAMYQLETIGKQPPSVFDNVRFSGFGAQGGRVSGHNVFLKNTIEGFTFENSIIHFDASTKLINVQFTHCVFIFPQDANPPQPLQQIGATLLASDLENVRITTG
ncbi:MAG TPA: hypothetical protein VNZ03_00990 [Terriglobales bacterium]|jgi:hypothetical protein|nr:hypothetical protein [Terriglobales bacterium]